MVLRKFGLEVDDDASPMAPHPCFEAEIRKEYAEGEAKKSGELAIREFLEQDLEIGMRAAEIRGSDNFQYIDEANRNKTDIEVVALSYSQCESFGGMFYSFCRDSLEQMNCTWHCRACKVKGIASLYISVSKSQHTNLPTLPTSALELHGLARMAL